MTGKCENELKLHDTEPRCNEEATNYVTLTTSSSDTTRTTWTMTKHLCEKHAQLWQFLWDR